MRQMGFDPVVRVSDFEENLPKSLPVREFVEKTAEGKLNTVKQQMDEKKEHYDVIIACDTVIYFQSEIIGKPRDAQDAMQTLQRLRGETHFVYTGVAMCFADGSQCVFSEETKVLFGQFSDQLIRSYVDCGEPLNKAGSYSIAQRGAVFVKGIEGCFSNVVGLPIHAVCSRLAAKGIL